jgi:hypothetical protein
MSDRYLRFLRTSGVITAYYEGVHRWFHGLSGYAFKVCQPKSEDGWARMPEMFRRAEGNSDGRDVVFFIQSRSNSPYVDGQYVMMRVSSFRPFLEALTTHESERYLK